MFNPNRLSLAKMRRSMGGRDLAESSGVSAVHISRIEQGKAENIEDSTIEALAKALNFPIDFFFGNDLDLPSKDTASFRSLTAMSAKERDSALSAGGIAYIVSDWVSERYNLPEIDLLDMSHEREPQTAASTLRSHWGLGEKPISNVIKLLESKGVRIFSLCEKTKNVDAFSCWRNGIPYIFLNTFKTAEHSRFDALHELGHLVLHRHGKAQGREAEIEANKFASYFLIPAADLASKVSFVTSLNQLIELKKRWGVSVAALAYRLHKTGNLSDWQYRTFCIQINQKFRTAEPEGLPRERSVVWEKVFRELWKDGITTDNLARELFIPVEEIANLVFELTGNNVEQTTENFEFPKLRLVS